MAWKSNYGTSLPRYHVTVAKVMWQVRPEDLGTDLGAVPGDGKGVLSLSAE